jgi:hypothetical protein
VIDDTAVAGAAEATVVTPRTPPDAGTIAIVAASDNMRTCEPARLGICQIPMVTPFAVQFVVGG